jgi:hypothetical protein
MKQFIRVNVGMASYPNAFYIKHTTNTIGQDHRLFRIESLVTDYNIEE